MNDQPTPPPPDEPVKGRNPLLKIIWLLVAFLPSVAALIILQISKVGPGMLLVLVLINGVCSALASDGLTQGMKSNDAQGGLMFFLIVFFFVANVGVSIFIGCSSMLRI